MKKLRILLTGGGTGGHIYPIIAVAQKIQEWALRNGFQPDLRYFGEPGEYKEALKSNGIRTVGVAASKMRRYFSLLNIVDFFKFFFGFFQSLWKLYFFMPEVAFSKGGPGALSVLAACRFYFIPIAIHESDTVPGMTNRVSGRWAKVIDLAFARAGERFGKTKARMNIVGNPVRQEVLVPTPQEQAKESFGFDPNKPVVLVFGGSQGSNRMNEFVLANLEPLLLKFQVLHAVGRDKYASFKNQYDFATKNFSPLITAGYKPVPYLEDSQIAKALDAADLVVARGGAGAIFEIAAKGKPSIIVPFPEAAGDHQKENAYAYAETGAAVVIEQENMLPSIFLGQAEKILGDPELKKRMSGAASDFYQPEAADKISADVLALWQ